MKNSVKIALLGIGNVGSGVWEILERNHDRISKYTGVPIEVKRVLVRDVNKKRNVSVPADLLTASYADIVDDPEF